MQSARAERGTKRTCTSCGERFYDLDRDPIVCPACEFAHAPSAFVRIMPVIPVPEVKAKPEPDKEDGDDDLEIEDVELDDDDDDALLPDDDNLDDDSDIADVAVDVDDDEEAS